MTEYLVRLIDRVLARFNLILRRKTTWDELLEGGNRHDLEYRNLVAMRRHRDRTVLEKILSCYLPEECVDQQIKISTPHPFIGAYTPTFSGFDKYIDIHHETMASWPQKARDEPAVVGDVPGWLAKADVLKLYEMAYFCEGNILEIGSFEGFSTSIMAKAVRNSRRDAKVIAVELDPRRVRLINKNLTRLGLQNWVQMVCGDASEYAAALVQAGTVFGFVFVDHCHSYKATYDICTLLLGLMCDGAYCLFHDFTSIANFEVTNPDYGLKNYGVPHAVFDVLPKSRFECCGVYGLSALFRKRPLSE